MFNRAKAQTIGQPVQILNSTDSHKQWPTRTNSKKLRFVTVKQQQDQKQK